MLSIVVPTHNRAESAVKLAEVLDSQECSIPCEVIFALDGCTDGTRELLESLSLQRPFKMVEMEGLGAAAARNRGVAEAEGELLLFMDDDVLPQPGALDAHVRLHAPGERLVVVGPYPYAPEMPVNPLDFHIREWWRGRCEALADPTHRFTFGDCLTGNLSLRRCDFEAVGGFDEAFEKDGREDYELGVRLLKSGLQMKFAPNALAYHYPKNTPKSLLRKWYTFGRADVHFIRKHPEVFHSLPIRYLLRKSCWRDRWARRLALSFPLPGVHLIRMLGAVFERNLHRLWDRRLLWLLYRSQRVAYLYGAASVLGGGGGLDAFVRSRMEPVDWPKSCVRIRDVDILSDLHEIGEADGCEELFVVARVGSSVAGWVDLQHHPGRGPVPVGEIASSISNCASWPAWRLLVASNGAVAPSDSAEDFAWQELKRRVRRLPRQNELARRRAAPSDEHHWSRISAVILDEGETKALRDGYSNAGCAQVVGVQANGGGLRRKLKAALSICRQELVAFLKPSDDVDIGWAEAVARHFLDRRVSCVIAPVILRDVRTRGEELYHALVDFERVRSWEAVRLTGWMPPAKILSEFNTECHRFVFRRKALAAAGGSVVGCEDAVPRFLNAVLNAQGDIVYEPRAIIWRQSPVGIADVRGMAAEHSHWAFMAVSEMLASNGARIRGLRMLARLVRAYLGRLLGARGSTDWPASFAASELAAGLLGMCRAFAGPEWEDTADAPLTLREDGEMTWVS